MENSEVNQQRKDGLISTAVNIFTSPSEAFSAIDARPTKLFPLFLIFAGTALVMFWYFSMLDYAWYVDDTLSRMGEVTKEQLDRTRAYMESGSVMNVMLISVVGMVFSTLVIYLVLGGYLTLASMLGGDDYRFGHWFSLVCWTGLPALLTAITMGVVVLLNPDGQVSFYDLNALSLSGLGVDAGDNRSLEGWLGSINLTMLWSIALLIMGYKQWVNASWIKAATIVLTPYVLVYGIWLFRALT